MIQPVPEFQSFPLMMIVSNILNCKVSAAIRKISVDILQKLSQPIIVFSNEGVPLFFNKAFYDMAKLSIDQVPASSINFRNLDPKEFNLIQILDFGIPITDYQDSLINEPNIIPVKLSIYPIFSDHNDRIGALCLINDITNSITYNKLLKQSEVILDSINIGVIVVDRNLDITLFNKHIKKKFNLNGHYNLEDLFESLNAEYSEDDNCIIDLLKKKKEVRDYEIVLALNDINHSFICDTYLLKDDTDQIDGAIIFLKDFTKIKEYEEVLARSEKLSAIGQLAAATAHEIRNPLTTVRGFIQIINQKIREELDIDIFNSQMELIFAELDRVNQIITDFLNLAKPEQGQMEIININEVLTEALFLIEKEAMRKRISISKELDYLLPLVKADKGQLIQAFLNIINNSFQAMPERGNLLIKTNALQDQSKLLINIIDDGKGIPDEYLKKIFDPFFTTKEQGTGLGLAICNRIINDHNGEIQVKSKLGEGTQITIMLPAVPF